MVSDKRKDSSYQKSSKLTIKQLFSLDGKPASTDKNGVLFEKNWIHQKEIPFPQARKRIFCKEMVSSSRKSPFYLPE